MLMGAVDGYPAFTNPSGGEFWKLGGRIRGGVGFGLFTRSEGDDSGFRWMVLLATMGGIKLDVLSSSVKKAGKDGSINPRFAVLM